MVGGQEPCHLDPTVAVGRHEAGQQRTDEKVGARLGPHVGVVAHLQPLCRHREDVDGLTRLDGGGDCRFQDRPDGIPQQHDPGDGLRRLHTEPRSRPRPLVDPGKGTVALRAATVAVLDDEHRRRGSEHRRHRPDGGVLVGGLEVRVARGNQRLGRLRGCRPAFRHDRDPGGAPQGVADLLPGNGGTGVQERPLPHARHHVAGRRQPAQHRGGAVEAPADLGIGRVDALRGGPIGLDEGGDQGGVAPGGDAPVDVDDRRPLGADGVAEQLEADVHHGDAPGEPHDGAVIVVSHE